MAKYHLSFPTTVTQLMGDVKTLAKHDVTAIALGNLGQWEGLMYLEYFTDRLGGPQVFLNIQDGQKGAWSNPAIIQALTDIQTLAKDNAFEQGYNQIDWPTGFTDALVHSGAAAMQLMGDWDIGFMQGYFPGWVASGAMGIGFFPTVPGGKGNPADLEGNTTNYVELSAHISPRADVRGGEVRGMALLHPGVRKVRGQRGPGAGHRRLAEAVRVVPVEAVPGTDLQRRPKSPVLPVLLGPGPRPHKVDSP